MTDKGMVLVTGATGFVGKWTIVRLLQAGYRVRGTIRSMRRANDVLKSVTAEVGRENASRLELVEADLLDDRGWAEAMQGVTCVMHVAAAIRADCGRGSSARSAAATTMVLSSESAKKVRP